ncbi:MAG: TIGR00159 family protein [Verrucomicrobia bacterium]|nr:TIGR00159 family protein [Verrucomicrobiota bacterium]
MIKFLNDWGRPAVEIVILAVAIYFAFSLVRRSRGAPVFTGFIVLLITFAVLSYVLHLEVLTTLLQKFFGLLAVAVLIIFQPELRRILAELGNRPLFSGTREQRENIEVIVETAARLADVKIGALIAIEQANNLRHVVESGIEVDCVATPEMLEAIFFPNNAIHDGGVILKGDRIAYAACIFPLTQRDDLRKSLGTRHRAAIGLTEETDALVVIVSEETGQISTAHHGELTRNLREEQLREFLTTQLVTRARGRSLGDWVRAIFGSRHAAPRANPK